MGKRVYTPKEVLAKSYDTLPWGGEWAEAFGTPEVNALWMVHGPSGAGKSSFMMQLARELCRYGSTLYCSYEEGVGQSFQQRLERHRMNELSGRFRIAPDDTLEELTQRLARKKSPRFIIIDSIQYAGWSYEETMALVNRFRRKCFIIVSQEYKGQPLGKPAVRLKFAAGVKVRVSGYRAYCQGRFIPAAGASFTIWDEGIMRTTNNADMI